MLYPNNRIILNIEKINEKAPNNDQRVKHRKFYIKNGYKSSGISVIQKNNVFENLIFGGDCNIREYHMLLKRFAGVFLYPFFKPKLSYST